MTTDTLPRICVVVGRTRHKMVQAELHEAVKRGAQLIELRLDFLARAVDFKRIGEWKACPLVATIRRVIDGGRYGGTEEQRQMLIRQTIVSGVFDWIDLETDVADTVRRFGNVKRIISYHNLQETPANLDEIYAKMCEQDADIVKLAVVAQRPQDQLRILRILRNAEKPTIGHCMGEFGFASRILALKYGVPFIYAAFNKERGIAPGLPSFDDLRNNYGVDRMNADTQIFGVVGDPVSHSMSPAVHNYLFRKHNINAVYLPFRVSRGELDDFVKAFDTLPVQGYSVTIPHKEAAAKLATTSDGIVTGCGAANTLIKRDDGFFAANTDAMAAEESIVKALTPDPIMSLLSGRSVMILGAGGAARAIAHGLSRVGCTISITSRTLERSAKLAEEIKGKAIDWQTRMNNEVDILINCTPVGMHPNVDESPMHKRYFQDDMIVFDTVYNPETTLFIKEARLAGATVVTGVEMFFRQASAQFQLFTGQVPDAADLLEMLRRMISPLTQRDGPTAPSSDEES